MKDSIKAYSMAAMLGNFLKGAWPRIVSFGSATAGHSKYAPHQGTRERARRIGQMANGELGPTARGVVLTAAER